MLFRSDTKSTIARQSTRAAECARKSGTQHRIFLFSLQYHGKKHPMPRRTDRPPQPFLAGSLRVVVITGRTTFLNAKDKIVCAASFFHEQPSCASQKLTRSNQHCFEKVLNCICPSPSRCGTGGAGQIPKTESECGGTLSASQS